MKIIAGQLTDPATERSVYFGLNNATKGRWVIAELHGGTTVVSMDPELALQVAETLKQTARDFLVAERNRS